MAAENPISYSYSTTERDNSPYSSYDLHHGKADSVTSIASSVYSVHPSASPYSHPYNSLLSGGPISDSSAPYHTRNSSTITVPPKSSLRLLNTLHNSIVQDEIQEVSEEEDYLDGHLSSTVDHSTVSTTNPHFSVNSTVSTTSTGRSMYQSLNFSNDSNITEHPDDIYSPANYTYDQLSPRQLSFIQEFGQSLSQQLHPTTSVRQPSQKSQKSNRSRPGSKGHGRKNISQMSMNMEELVRSFEQELSALDGFGELQNDSDISDSEDTANISIVTSNKSLEPSAIPYISQSQHLSSNPTASPVSMNSSLDNFSPMTPKTPKTPKYNLNAQDDSHAIRRKPSVMGKFRTLGKRIISGGHSQSSPAISPNAKFTTPPIGGADGFGSPGHASVRTPLITMKFSSEKKSAAH